MKILLFYLNTDSGRTRNKKRPARFGLTWLHLFLGTVGLAVGLFQQAGSVGTRLFTAGRPVTKAEVEALRVDGGFGEGGADGDKILRR